MTKNPITSENLNVETTKTHDQKDDYTTIADRLRTVNSSDCFHSNGVVKPIYGISNFTLTAKDVKSNKHYYKS